MKAILVFVKNNLNFVFAVFKKFWLLFFYPLTHSPIHQVEIASMQTVSIKTLNIRTHGHIQTDRWTQRQERQGKAAQYCQQLKRTKDQGKRTEVNALPMASEENTSKVYFFANDTALCLTKFFLLM